LKLVVAALLVLQVVASVPSSKSFSTELEVVELDGSNGKMTWNYDAAQQRELIVYHREEGKDTKSIIFYNQGVEFLVIDDSCYTLSLKDKSIPTPSDRIASLGADKEIKYFNTVEGPVDPSLFEIPSSCSTEQVEGAICDGCMALGDKVITLGCNASSSAISHLCGTYAMVCQFMLDKICSGVCVMEECACDVCTKFELCSYEECANSTNSTSSSSSSSSTSTTSHHHTTTSSSSSSSSFSSLASHVDTKLFEQEKQESKQDTTIVQGGIFCDSCLSVAQQVINLGCNATSAEISNLCGSLFAEVCQQALDTLCSGACNIEDCANQSCCLFKLCSGSTCNSTLTIPPNHVSTDKGLVKLQL